LGNRCFWRRK